MVPGRDFPARFFMVNAPRFIAPKRKLFQWVSTLLLLLIPWFEIGGNSLLRIDFSNLSIHIFWQVLRIQELFLILLLTLILVLGFLLITVVLGRVWCGWCCPQTTLSDIAEWAARKLGLTVKNYSLHGALWRKIVLHIIFLLLGFIIASNLLWYFIPPEIFFVRLVNFDLHYAAWVTFILTTLTVYLNLAVFRRILCRDFCPYGRIQTSIVDKATLSLHLPDEEIERCIECESCVRACPMEIDIRNGYQVECTNCGRCLDACRRIMVKRSEPGLIRYSFGLHGEGVKGLLNPRVLLPAAAMLIMMVILAIALIDRPTATIKVAISHTAATRRLDDGSTATFINAWIHNRSQQTQDFLIRAKVKETGTPLTIKGQVQRELAGGENSRLDFVLITKTGVALTAEFVLTGKDGVELSVAEAYIEKAPEK